MTLCYFQGTGARGRGRGWKSLAPVPCSWSLNKSIIIPMSKRADHFRISDFTDDSKPREKLLSYGADVLSDAELLAILLGSGTRERNVLELSNDILRDHGGLSGLRKISKEELSKIRGIGPAKSTSILAAIELGKRFSKAFLGKDGRPRLRSQEDIYAYCHYQMEHLDHEELLVISLDSKHYVIGEEMLYKGTVSSSNIRVAEIFRKPILLNAASFVLVHNHPSGDPSPSAADIVSTRNIIETGKKLDLPLLDHIIIGAGSYTSIKNYLN